MGTHQRSNRLRLLGADQRRDDLALAAEHGLDDGRVQECLRRCASRSGEQSATDTCGSQSYVAGPLRLSFILELRFKSRLSMHGHQMVRRCQRKMGTGGDMPCGQTRRHGPDSHADA